MENLKYYVIGFLFLLFQFYLLEHFLFEMLIIYPIIFLIVWMYLKITLLKAQEKKINVFKLSCIFIYKSALGVLWGGSILTFFIFPSIRNWDVIFLFAMAILYSLIYLHKRLNIYVKNNELKYFNYFRFMLFSLSLALIGYRINDGLTASENLYSKYLDAAQKSNLAYKLYLKNIEKNVIGSVCNDGWISSSSGRGSCSWHGGVASKRFEYIHRYSKEECQKIIEKQCKQKSEVISWID